MLPFFFVNLIIDLGLDLLKNDVSQGLFARETRRYNFGAEGISVTVCVCVCVCL